MATGRFSITSSLVSKGRYLRPEVREARAALITEEKAKAARNERAILPDERREILSLTVRLETGHPELVLLTGDTNYYTIRTLQELRMKKGRDKPTTVARYFQNHWGMSTLVEARGDDGQPVLVFSRRSARVDFYPGCYNVTASGAMEKDDFDALGQMNLLRVATRELGEETGIQFGSSDTYEVLGLGYNPEKSDWNLQTLVRTNQPAREILANRGKAPDAWETDDLFLVDASRPETVIAALRKHESEWTPTGAAAADTYLRRVFGSVDLAA
ncbi:hypothetical protein [Ktedonospora formicarum]|uniref:Nudix hydrolase domain-containing protein n=1 Tax=Ktedonospora formicarum TaxID=2778364 RepID=A0A8J3I2N6_9CHLR|nr:hypothetical protein [Ktedonospora formicarum]GHO48977.1 hypothetical protein KSX_71400 [Ktedonospora formicarum]